MICRATSLVKIVCTKELWIKRSSFAKSRCQSGLIGLMAEIGLAIMADRHQTLAAAWRPRVADVLTSQAHIRCSPVTLCALISPPLLPPSLASVYSSRSSSVQRHRRHCRPLLTLRSSVATAVATTHSHRITAPLRPLNLTR